MLKRLFTFAFILLITISLYSQEKAETKYWIIFKDKGKYKYEDKIVKGNEAYNAGLATISDRAIQRRLKVLTEENLIDFGDLPLIESYINDIEKLGIDLIAKSKWLNGVSAYLTLEQVEKVKKLDFVLHLKLVNKLITQSITSLVPIESSNRYDNIIFRVNDGKNILNYGNSLTQMSQIDVPKVHNLGITGKGVLVASFDDGFTWKNHEALKDLNVIEEYDFINKDENTSNEEKQKYEDSREQSGHGTSTFSSMAGFKEGKLIGPAFGSEFILAKTEYTSSETPMEEDFWLEAAEWAEAKGVDIITSSLIYKEFDKPYTANSYKYENFDGKTAITSIAASRCAYLGIVVLNAVGNYNHFENTPPTLGSPSDADSIITVGAVFSDGSIAYFSSNGPTSDGRTKPDVLAMGVSVCVASKRGEDTYEFSNGTSFSTPITAGVVALLLSVHPELTPIEVREALRMTASNYLVPDNLMGWGIINAYNALLYYGMIWSNEVKAEKSGDNLKISISLASKFMIESSKIFYSTDNGNTFNEMSMNYIQGNEDGNKSGLYSAVLPDVPSRGNIYYYFYSKNTGSEESVYPLGANRKLEKCFKYSY
jgi:serine protease AprX